MIQRLSLRVKLTLGYVLVFTVTVLLGGGGVFFAARSALTASLDTTLRETASVARASIMTAGTAASFAPQLRPAGDLHIELYRPDGTPLAQVGDGDEGPVGELRPGLSTTAERRVLTQQVEGLYLRVSRPSETLSEFLDTLARLLLLGSGGMILAACGGGYWLANRALRPVDAVARTAELIAGQGDYAQRVPQAPGGDEMARLTRTVNTMLDRLAGTIEREKQFARTAAHELRTPLTALRGRLDLTLERPRDAAEYEKALRSMQGRVDALGRLTEGLLALARTDAPAPLERVELASIAIQVSEQFEAAAAEQGQVVRLDLEESWVQADAAGLERVLSNLLENALKYGVGPEIRVVVRPQTLIVQDTGPGPDPAQWPRLLQPFERGSGVQGVSGSGLGLALVATLAARWGARLEPGWSEHGFQVTLRFPAAS
ncbi:MULTISPECIES: sensor histidine kinase [Deinococcus]|uniref:histidine kinase n=1 Tax=Deinococcus rufus TaxID=2136097 RepID=A0ABV7Z7B6_9DEIO|nr:HAMP domain-containing sensor histidine kinase [Deinococcus sp. AB2017081]WQE97231.1 HAMP domain-containing sensor histidine kinase [Deinococcus sp. AB2017081]